MRRALCVLYITLMSYHICMMFDKYEEDLYARIGEAQSRGIG